jgi:hypothetical protein
VPPVIVEGRFELDVRELAACGAEKLAVIK